MKIIKTVIRAVALTLLACILLVGCKKTPVHSNNGIVVTNSLDGKPVLVGNIPITFPLVSQPYTLNIMATGYDDIDMSDVYVMKKYSEMTGVNVNWTTVTKSKRAEAVLNVLTNKQNVDMILRCKLSSNRLTQYGESGLILDLAKDDMLKTYAPNCWKYLQTHPDTLASVMNPDGTIYALPQVNSGAELRVSRKIFINKNWLKNVGMEIPTTTEEFYNLLKAFKTQDANGNGNPDDEIPLCSQDWLSIQEAFFGAFGLGNRGLHNQEVDCLESTGGVRLIAASDGYRDYLEYFNRLYSEGLMDGSTFSMADGQWYNNAKNDLIGVFVNTNLASLPADKVDNWVAVGEALEGPNGDKMWSAVRANFHSTGAAVIPATCSNPALCLRWLDYFWTDEGTLFYHMGIEGETFIADEDGTYDYMPKIYEQIQDGNHSFDEVIAAYSPYPGGSNPTVEIAPYFMGGEMADVPSEAARKLFEYGPKEYWPSFTFTAAENDKLDSIRTDIVKYRDTMCSAFVMGTKSLSEWDTYVEQLEKLNMAEMLVIYQAAVYRYQALNTVLG